MKTFKPTQLAILFLLFCLCCTEKNTNNVYKSNKSFDKLIEDKYLPKINPNCENDLKGSVKLNELIVRIDPCYQKKWNKKIDKILRKINKDTEALEVDTCQCDSTVILFKSKNNPNPEERLASANKDLMPEGTTLGSAYYNFDLNIDTPPVLRDVKEFQPEPDTIKHKLIVAVIDGGIRWNTYTHLEQYMWKNNKCGKDTSRLNLTLDKTVENNHGSIVASIIVKHVNPLENIKLMDVRIFDNKGRGTLFEALCGISFAINNGADLINTSWGYYDIKDNPTLKELTWEAKMKEIIMVSSAGNNGLNTDFVPHFPSSLDHQKYKKWSSNMIGVGYLNKQGNDLHECSNRGKRSVSLATIGIIDTPSGSIEGSSYAAPRVTRAMAIIKGKHYDRDHYELIQCLYDNTIDMGIEVNTRGRLKDPIQCQFDRTLPGF
jgi:subtilisin family serine protease